jgi:hypothetical protein
MSAYFAPLVLLPVVVTAPGRYLTRCGEQVLVRRASSRHDFGCAGEYACGTREAWHRSGRLYAGIVSRNDIVSVYR